VIGQPSAGDLGQVASLNRADIPDPRRIVIAAPVARAAFARGPDPVRGTLFAFRFGLLGEGGNVDERSDQPQQSLMFGPRPLPEEVT